MSCCWFGVPDDAGLRVHGRATEVRAPHGGAFVHKTLTTHTTEMIRSSEFVYFRKNPFEWE